MMMIKRIIIELWGFNLQTLVQRSTVLGYCFSPNLNVSTLICWARSASSCGTAALETISFHLYNQSRAPSSGFKTKFYGAWG